MVKPLILTSSNAEKSIDFTQKIHTVIPLFNASSVVVNIIDIEHYTVKNLDQSSPNNMSKLNSKTDIRLV